MILNKLEHFLLKITNYQTTKNKQNINPLLIFIVSTFIFTSISVIITNYKLTGNAFMIPAQSWYAAVDGVDFVMLQEYGLAYNKNLDTSPEGRNPYPPLTSLISGKFLQLLTINKWRVIIICTFLLSALLITFLYYYYYQDKQLHKSLFYLIFTILSLLTLFSYPAHFEIERGQFNFIAFFITLLSLFFFINNTKFNPISNFIFIILASLAIHIKVYPLIISFPFFILLLSQKNTKSLKTTFAYLALILTVNLLMLLGPGLPVINGFIRGLIQHENNPFIWHGNHSLYSFTSLNLTSNYNWILVFIYIYFISKIILKSKFETYWSYMLPLFVFSCLLIKVSHDYKLSFLIPASAVHFIKMKDNNLNKIYAFIISLLISFILIPYSNIPYFKSKTPSLLLILFVYFFWSYLNTASRKLKEETNKSYDDCFRS